jgi:hypothetical protein
MIQNVRHAVSVYVFICEKNWKQRNLELVCGVCNSNQVFILISFSKPYFSVHTDHHCLNEKKRFLCPANKKSIQ